MPWASMHSPVEDLTISEEDGHIVSLDWGWAPGGKTTPVLGEAIRQLNAYFDGQLATFDLPLAPVGTDHQTRVWSIMRRIGFGETLTYGEIARQTGGGARAVGTACGRNPIPVIIPCHRVVAAGNRPGGYSGGLGLETKAALLRLEGASLDWLE